MMNQSLTLILTLLISLGGISTAEARALRCDSIFQPTVADVINQLHLDNPNFLFKEKSFENYTENLSWLRKRKIRKLIRDLEVRNFPSEKAVERYSMELGTALFGSKEAVDRWILKSPDARLEESTILLIKEQLLQQGLLKTWGRVYDPAQISLLSKFLDRMDNLKSAPLAALAKMPFILPALKNSSISPELMSKIIRDGFLAHAEEARIALKQQNKIEAYNTFRKLYSPIFFGVMLIVQVEQAYQNFQNEVEAQVQQTIQNLREQRENIEKNVPLLKQQEFERVYAASVQEFIQKWGEAPTPEEASLIKAKIEKALNMP